jgi:hypothetical protein
MVSMSKVCSVSASLRRVLESVRSHCRPRLATCPRLEPVVRRRSQFLGEAMAMSKHAAKLCVVATILAFAAQTASAEREEKREEREKREFKGCPAGQAVQGVDFRHRSLVCVPVAGGDVSALQAQLNAANAAITALRNALNAEVGARQSGIATEAAARQQGDADVMVATRAATDQQIAAEAAARSAGDTAALANANAYTDIKVAGVGGGGGTTGQNATTVFGVTTLSLPSVSEVYTMVPGLSQTITVPANSFVYISTDGGVAVNSGTADAGSAVDVGLFVDGNLVGNARRLLPRNTSVAPGTVLMAGFETWSMALSTELAESTHTIDVGARLADGARAVVSANSGVLQGKLTILIVKK